MAAEAVDKNAKQEARRSIVVVLLGVDIVVGLVIVLTGGCCCWWWWFRMCWDRAVERVRRPATEQEGFITDGGIRKYKRKTRRRTRK